jgi:hypothetical protein
MLNQDCKAQNRIAGLRGTCHATKFFKRILARKFHIFLAA